MTKVRKTTHTVRLQNESGVWERTTQADLSYDHDTMVYPPTIEHAGAVYMLCDHAFAGHNQTQTLTYRRTTPQKT